MFGHHPVIKTISTADSTIPDLTKELDKIEVTFGELDIVFEEDYLPGFEGEWSFCILNRTTEENVYMGFEKDELADQRTILHILKNQDIPSLLAIFKDENGISSRAVRKLIIEVLDQYKDDDHKPPCKVVETPKRPDPLANENLDEEAIRIKELLCGTGFPLKNFTLRIHGKFINERYYSKGLFLSQDNGEKIAMRLRNDDMANIINRLKMIKANETVNTDHLLSLANFIASKSYDGRRMGKALTDGHIQPVVKAEPEYSMLRLRIY